MKKSKGKANPKILNEILKQKLSKKINLSVKILYDKNKKVATIQIMLPL